jgi:hypothetical protein
LNGIDKNRLTWCFHSLKNENGSAIVIALIVLAAVTIIGIASTNFSVTELLISGNDTVKKISFFNADAGIFAIPKVISLSINNKQTPTINPIAPYTFPPFVYNDPGADTTTGDRSFYRELAGLAGYDAASDITYQNDGIHNTDVDIKRLGSFSLTGGGAEFGSGAEGHGTGMRGVRFMLTSTGRGQKNAQTTIDARYLKVLGAAGGL